MMVMSILINMCLISLQQNPHLKDLTMEVVDVKYLTLLICSNFNINLRHKFTRELTQLTLIE